MNFLKNILATVIGIILTFVIFLFIFIGIVSSLSQKEPITVKSNSILKLDLTKIITERQPLDVMSEYGLGDNDEIQGLNKIKAAIKAAKNDIRIKGIYLDAGIFTGAGLATLEEIRNELLNFKKSGKFIIAYGENYNQKAYYLSTAADKIYLNPLGVVDFRGFNAQITFFKNAMDKLDVDMQIIRGPGNKFKSAVEPFMLDHMSEANREQTKVFLGALWNNMLNNISRSRNISTETLQKYADNLTGYNAFTALKAGLVDSLAYSNDIRAKLRTLTGTPNNKKLKFITLAKYSKTLRPANRKARNKIAVIYAQGEIVAGEGDDQTIGSKRLCKAIRKAREDSAVKAVVFRVNSPGGSAQASEIIYRELILTKEVKPLVVSMGDLAASGGYYISCLADKIYAQPNTITGSIGVFGMIPNLQHLLNDKLGITFDGVKTARNADIYSTVKPLTPYQTEVIRNMIDLIYQTFITHVADGRNMTKARVDSIGQGRVWSGTDAIKIGLVDKLGGIDDAIKDAAQLANIQDYKIKELPKLKNPIDQFVDKLNGKVSVESFVKEQSPLLDNYIELVKLLNSKDNIQARLPFSIDIE